MSNNSTEESSLFRSETMSLVQLYIPSELAHTTVNDLGELGLLQFKDLNSSQNNFQRTFATEIKRLDEMDRRLRYVLGLFEKFSIRIKPNQTPVTRARQIQEVDELDSELAEIEKKFVKMQDNLDLLLKRHLELTELRHVLRETSYFFDEATPGPQEDRGLYSDEESLLMKRDLEANRRIGESSLNFVAGVLSSDRLITFEKVLWRVLRGNLYMKTAEIDEPLGPDMKERKIVFVIFATGTELLAKIRKISEAMGATLYPLANTQQKRSEDSLEVTARIEDLNNVVYSTQQTLLAELLKLSTIVEWWKIVIRKEKGIYHTLNKFNFDQTRKCLIAEGWCPTASINAIQYVLHGVSESSGSLVPPLLNTLTTKEQPPTYFRHNKITKAFQAIIDAYGVAKYKEVNPALFTVITFPFLFAVMFGDWGHGSLMLFAALYLVINEKKLSKPGQGEMFEMLFGGRYIILFMSIFSIYVGFIYNDGFSLPMFYVPSGWSQVTNPSSNNTVEFQMDYVYPFGIDPQWRLAANSMVFSNSYKMKMSIIIGVTHMMFGISLSVFNHRYFKKPINIIAEFIPQVIFLMSLFGYLTILIIYKWLKPINSWGPHGAPGLLNTLIFMVLKPGTVTEELQLYQGQSAVQVFLVLLAVVCIPWMLLLKPWYLWNEHKKTVLQGYGTISNRSPAHESDAQSPVINVSDSSHEEHGSSDDHDHERFDFTDVIVHQVIHTIEFCLGCVSNTASYLRLWALSLAHSQLSEVLWDMTMVQTMRSSLVFVGFAGWFTMSVAILIMMEGLSAFLHALRLHWVEFNGKFYEGSGKPFLPFDLNKEETDE